ncbi:hypothetical protein [Streptomyces sp. enrichment culture]|uniref:hypothetical protein n=1 Tax=Streptomyces sp. enrichment culture TaxID=1795815 RepID=UPI003F54318E
MGGDAGTGGRGGFRCSGGPGGCYDANLGTAAGGCIHGHTGTYRHRGDQGSTGAKGAPGAVVITWS